MRSDPILPKDRQLGMSVENDQMYRTLNPFTFISEINS